MGIKVELTLNKYSLIDEEDLEKVNKYKWCYSGGYAIHNCPRNGQKKRKRIYMHRLVMNCPNDLYVDHINGDPLDNRKENLRICTFHENRFNRIKHNKNTSSRYKGVRWHKKNKKWEAKLIYKEKYKYLGNFDNEIEAAKAYNAAAIKYFGKFARLNEIKDET